MNCSGTAPRFARALSDRAARYHLGAMIPLLALLALSFPVQTAAAKPGLPRVLFFTHSAGFVHDVVKRPAPGELAPAEQILTQVAAGRFDVSCSQDCADLAAAKLPGYDAVVFMTTGELPLPREDRDALIAWIAHGGAFAGV